MFTHESAQPSVRAVLRRLLRARRLHERTDLGAGLLALMLACLYQSWPGLGPASFWLDDLWVATLIKCASLKQLYTLHSPAPLGFLALLKLICLFGGDGHLAMQVLACGARLLGVAATGWVAARLANSAGVGLIAAAGMAMQSELAMQSIRIKQYTLDALVSVVLVGAALYAMERWRERRLIGLGLAALLALPFAFTSAFVGPILFTLVGLAHAVALRQRGSREVRRVLTIVGCIDAAIIGLLVLMVSRQATPQLKDFWQANYLPTTSWPEFVQFFRGGPGLELFTGSFLGWPWLALVQCFGIVSLLRTPRVRVLGVYALLLYPVLIASSALRLFPIGEPRTDCFLRPIVILLTSAALLPLARFRLAAMAVGLLAAFAATLQVATTRVSYIDAGEKVMVEIASTLASDPDTGLVVSPWANWAIAYYGPWRTKLIPVTDSTNSFFAVPRRPNSVVLRETWKGMHFNQYLRDAQIVDEQLGSLLDKAPKAIVYLGAHDALDNYRATVDHIRHRGYRLESQQSQTSAYTALLVRH